VQKTSAKWHKAIIPIKSYHRHIQLFEAPTTLVQFKASTSIVQPFKAAITAVQLLQVSIIDSEPEAQPCILLSHAGLLFLLAFLSCIASLSITTIQPCIFVQPFSLTWNTSTVFLW